MIKAELDRVQRFLQDATVLGQDGRIWSRAELLAYYEDGYRHLLAETAAAQRFTVLGVPPRFPWVTTHPWEQAFTGDSPPYQWAHQGLGGWAASSAWGLEQIEGITPTASGTGLTQPWQRFLNNPAQQHFTFGVPRESDRIIKIWYDDKLLVPLGTRALDAMETDWYSLDGEPVSWVRGIGQNRTFEVFAIQTAYANNYRFRDAVTNNGVPLHGTMRRATGGRTYAWASDSGDAVPYGIARRISSPDRQYYPRMLGWLNRPLGRTTWFDGSADNLLILEARVPDIVDLGEADDPALLPPQLNKYVRYYTLLRAFNRQGEGYDGLMALVFEARFARGVRFLRRLKQLARKDRRMQRDPVQPERRRPPRTRLPSNYPRTIPV